MRFSRIMLLSLATLLAASLFAAACNGGDSGEGTPTAGTTRTVEDAGMPEATVTPGGPTATAGTPATPGSGGTPAPGDTPDETIIRPSGTPLDPRALPSNAQAAVELAIEDLADTFDREPDEIAVESVVATQWPDSCLGGARPGEACAQVITPGYEVVLVLEGSRYYYHTDDGNTARLVDFELTGGD
jgi:hypothetical protein